MIAVGSRPASWGEGCVSVSDLKVDKLAGKLKSKSGKMVFTLRWLREKFCDL